MEHLIIGAKYWWRLTRGCHDEETRVSELTGATCDSNGVPIVVRLREGDRTVPWCRVLEYYQQDQTKPLSEHFFLTEAR